MIIGIGGKIGSGKDTVGKIIQYLTMGQEKLTFEEFNNMLESTGMLFCDEAKKSNWQIKKFAGKLKQIVSILTGCTVEDLESQEFKNKQLSAEWNHVYKWLNGNTAILGNFPVNVDTYKDDEVFKNNPERFIHRYTYRDLLQRIGTNAMRDLIHENVWVNALMGDYKCSCKHKMYDDSHVIFNTCVEPNWIITDMRFPNELNAIEERGGITIRVERKKFNDVLIKRDDAILLPNMRYQIPENDEIPKKYWGKIIECKEYQWFEKVEVKFKDEHLSETALDNIPFKYRIENDGTIEELVEKVKEILIKEKII